MQITAPARLSHMIACPIIDVYSPSEGTHSGATVDVGEAEALATELFGVSMHFPHRSDMSPACSIPHDLQIAIAPPPLVSVARIATVVKTIVRRPTVAPLPKSAAYGNRQGKT